ncbi:MAG: squalene--hopene cyclase, partial [Leptolyngbyaceae bacterium]|nr:squalene--hopene cyclase [Leptolyngbyaceae bacterium]
LDLSENWGGVPAARVLHPNFRTTLLSPVEQEQLKEAIATSQRYLLSQQQSQGYWWAELESNVTITAEVVLLHKIWGTDGDRPLHKAETYLRREQRDHGGWELFYGDGGNLSTSVEAYLAMRLLGVPVTDPALVKAKEFILTHGGISKCRVFTKFHLALIGAYDWRGVPSIPPWIMLLPQSYPIYEMSSWARGSTVPLLIVFDQKPIYPIHSNSTDAAVNLNELYPEGRANADYGFPENGDWTDIFLGLDQAFKLAEAWDLVPFRAEGLRAAEKWVLERQESTGDWGGIIPAMLNSMLALRSLGYDPDDPIAARGFAAIDDFAVESAETYHIQPCISPVWDTAWCIRALRDSGLGATHPSLVQAGQWLLDQQILHYGDWAVKNTHGRPGGWAFEFVNNWYPDVDDSAVVVMALSQVQLPNEKRKQGAIARAVDWIATMQCDPGGWGAFDLNNDQDWLNALPYADLKAMIDPNTADVTARVLEMVGYLSADPVYERSTCTPLPAELYQHNPYRTIPNLLPTETLPLPGKLWRSLHYLLNEQESDGAWFGRWGVNYIYGTSGALSALALVQPEQHQGAIAKGATWLVQCQNEDGGWGETCWSYNDPSLRGQGHSTASQTAWALIGLIAAVDAAPAATTLEATMSAIHHGIRYLIQTQQTDGKWDESYFTGTGFPCHFYLKYHMYQQYFPLIALGRYHARFMEI